MALTGTSIYSGVTLASTATPKNPYSAMNVMPVLVTPAGPAVVFNFVMASGTTACGPNAIVEFNWAFSMSTYSGANLTNISSILGNSAGKFNVRLSNQANALQDITTQFAVPILGNNLYCWLNLKEFYNPLTTGFTASAVSLSLSNRIFNV